MIEIGPNLMVVLVAAIWLVCASAFGCWLVWRAGK